MIRAAIFCLLAVVSMSPLPLAAQQLDSAFAWLKEHGVSVRRTFDGSKNENQPASLQMVESDKPQDDSYFLADAAIKGGELELGTTPALSLVFYPVLEWHRSTQQDKAVDNTSLSVKGEFRPFPLRMQQVHGPLPAGVPAGNPGWSVAPTFMGEVGRYWDEAADSSVTKVALNVFPTSNIEGLPGSDIRDRSGAFRARYYAPYVGFERWESRGLWEGETASFMMLRGYLEAVPMGTLQREYLEFISEYTHRWRIGGGDPVPNDLSLWVTSLTLYPNGTRQVGIGVDYSTGRDPSKGFSEVRRWTLGLKAKF
jgi:hypothetical protein